MFRPRVIPCLLLKDDFLVKTVKFKKPNYIGDPINAVKIFNDREADELIFLDINATINGRTPSLNLIKQIGEECNMPFAVGGGISTIEEMRKIFNAGAEKIIIGTEAAINPQFISKAASFFGSQSIVVCMDVKNSFFYGTEAVYFNAKKRTRMKPLEFALTIQQSGAGEIMINSVDRDGTFSGYDIPLIKSISKKLDIPVIASGGAGSLTDIKEVVNEGYASAAAAGSLFVYYRSKDSVLVNYPNKKDMEQLIIHY